MPVEASSRTNSSNIILRPLRLLGVVETRTPSARDGAGQRELRHGQDRAAGFGDVAIHLAGVVAENAQLANLLRGIEHDLLGVAFLYRGEDEQAGSDLGDDLFADGNGRAANALNDALHGGGFYSW